jgi:beta-fructofuranosidase
MSIVFHLPYCCWLLLSLQAVFSQGSASTVGVLLRSWHQGGEGGAAVLYNWESGLLEVVFEALDPATMSFSLTAPMARRIGGPLQQMPGQPLALRLLLDAR